jgi:hypothetical protein
MDPAQQQAQAMHLMAAILPMFFLFGLIGIAIVIVPLWKIATKAGLAGPIALLALFPGLGMLIALYVIAFSEWRVMPPAMYPPPAYPPVPPPGYAPPVQTYAPPAQSYPPPPPPPDTGV